MADGELFPTAVGLGPGDEGAEVDQLQDYLSRFGYLDTGDAGAFAPLLADGTPQPAAGSFDDATADALRRYQLFHGLPPTAQLDVATVGNMSKARCGVPDVTNVSRFTVQGNRWGTNDLRYGFANFSGDAGEREVRGAFRHAAALWSAITPLTFREVPIADNPEIRVQFSEGDHGDGSAFDGPNGVLAHAFFPPPNGGDIAGDVHFDEAEAWSVAVPVPAGAFDLVTVAAHELGHSLGLDHSTDGGALMFPSYSGPHRFLAPDDVSGIQTIYGTRPPDPTLRSGSRGEDVKRLQQALINLGFEPGDVDGIFGRKTKLAVQKFQASRELQPDGIVGVQTWAAIHAEGQ